MAVNSGLVLFLKTQESRGFNGFWQLTLTVEVCFGDLTARLGNVVGVTAKAGNEQT